MQAKGTVMKRTAETNPGVSAAMGDKGTGRPPCAGRGFASMDPTLRRELAKRGGKAAHALGKAHKFTSDEAREAGRRGGLAARRTNGATT
jgi:general stress protein YciG